MNSLPQAGEQPGPAMPIQPGMGQDFLLIGRPLPGHNQPPIAQLGREMTHHAALWASNRDKGERHCHEIMVRAYQLRLYAEDRETKLVILGLMTEANIKGRSGAEFT